MRFDQLPQLFIEHMRIDLCRGNVGMAQEFLHDAEIGAVGEKMACESVPDDMRGEVRRPDSGAGAEALEVAGEDLAGQMAGRAVCREKMGELPVAVERAQFGTVGGDCRDRRLRQRQK